MKDCALTVYIFQNDEGYEHWVYIFFNILKDMCTQSINIPIL